MQSSSARHFIVLLDIQDVPEADLQVLAIGLADFLCLSANSSGDAPAAVCLICLRASPSAATPVLELQSTSSALGRLLAEGHQIFHFNKIDQAGATANKEANKEVDEALTAVEREIAASPALSASVELCLLTRRVATIMNLRRSFGCDGRSYPNLVRRCRKIRLVHLPGYVAPKKTPAIEESKSNEEEAIKNFDQLVEVATVQRAEPELGLALRAWLLPPCFPSSETPTNRLIFPGNGFETERFLPFRLSNVVLNPGLISDPEVLDTFQPLFGPPSRLSRLVSPSSTDAEANSSVELEVCGLVSLERLSPADVFGYPMLMRPVVSDRGGSTVGKFRSLVKLLRQRSVFLLVRRQYHRNGNQLPAKTAISTDATRAKGDDAPTSTAAGPAAYFILGPTEHLADALVARAYACDDLVLQSSSATGDTGDVTRGSSTAAAVAASGDEADAKVSAALNSVDSFERWTPHDLTCHWCDYLASRATAAAQTVREK